MTSAYAFVMYMFYEVAQAHIDAVTIMHGLIKQAEEEARHSTKNNVSYALITSIRGWYTYPPRSIITPRL